MSSPPPLVSFTNITSNEDYQNENANTSPFQNMKPSILIILLILSITILLCISLCLLFRHLNRRLLRHHPSSNTTGTATVTTSSSSSSSSNCNNRISPEFYSVVDSLPLFTFSSIKHRSSSSSSDCAVCLSSFEPHDQLRLLPLCCHAFHSQCIDSWLVNNQTCPLCRSSIHSSDSDIMKATLHSSATNGGGGVVPRADSFRLQIGSISRRQDSTLERNGTSYTIGGYDYIVDEEAEVNVSSTQRRIVSDKAENETSQNLAAETASSGNGGWNWLKDYVDRLSSSLSASTSRAMSFRGSGRFFAGSSRRTEAFAGVGDYDIEQAGRVGEEISELFRWISGV